MTFTLFDKLIRYDKPYPGCNEDAHALMMDALVCHFLPFFSLKSCTKSMLESEFKALQ